MVSSMRQSWNSEAWEPPRVGARVDILGDGDPEHLVIAGGRLRHGRIFLPLLFSVVPFIFYIAAFGVHVVRTNRQLFLLQYGRRGEAKFVRLKPKRKGPDARVYEFFDGRRRRELVNNSPGRNDSDELEPILFDHRSGVFLEALPGHLRIEDGRFVAREPATRLAGAFAIAVVPVLLVLLAATFWYAEVRSADDLLRLTHPRFW
jgi:hypothetical protein